METSSCALSLHSLNVPLVVKVFSGVSIIANYGSSNCWVAKKLILSDWMKPSIMKVRIDVSLEQEEKMKGRLGCSEIPYTSEQ